MALEIASVLKGERGEELNEVCAGRSKKMATMTEGTLYEGVLYMIVWINVYTMYM